MSASVNPPGDDTARVAAGDKVRPCAGATIGIDWSSEASYARWTSEGIGDPMSVEAAAMRLAMIILVLSSAGAGTASGGVVRRQRRDVGARVVRAV